MRHRAGHPAQRLLVLVEHHRLTVHLEVGEVVFAELAEEILEIPVRRRLGRIEQIRARPAPESALVSVRAGQEGTAAADDVDVALPVGGEPDARLHPQRPDGIRECLHPHPREARIDAHGIAVLTGVGAAALPAVVDLDPIGAVWTQVIRHPACVRQNLAGGDLPIVVVPGAPAGRRKREDGLVDRFVPGDAERILVVVRKHPSVSGGHAVGHGIEGAVCQGRSDLAERGDQHVVDHGRLQAHRHWAGPPGDRPRAGDPPGALRERAGLGEESGSRDRDGAERKEQREREAAWSGTHRARGCGRGRVKPNLTGQRRDASEESDPHDHHPA